ncbi:hypothetical protein EVAR_10974_1 [Eumeta japonica]|uniref:Uncharacterized protein n=1 Tax=Eumeta variegata TaxID=151549 RepID=A0A4C1U622_EUMVA|nr:hypothetical protein EVAR_10974_1 [Eumeta japonica]
MEISSNGENGVGVAAYRSGQKARVAGVHTPSHYSFVYKAGHIPSNTFQDVLTCDGERRWSIYSDITPRMCYSVVCGEFVKGELARFDSFRARLVILEITEYEISFFKEIRSLSVRKAGRHSGVMGGGHFKASQATSRRATIDFIPRGVSVHMQYIDFKVRLNNDGAEIYLTRPHHTEQRQCGGSAEITVSNIKPQKNDISYTLFMPSSVVVCGLQSLRRLLNESTLPTNEALLLSYVRFIKDEKICQELLFARNLETDTKGETVFKTLEKFCNEKEIPLKSIISAATDGVPGDDLNLVKTKNVFAAFVAKLLLHKKNVSRREFHNFPNLSISCNSNDLLVYCQHLENLHSDFIERFQDLLKLEIPDWVLDPFSNVNIAISFQSEEELIELTTSEEIKIKYKMATNNFGYKSQFRSTLDSGLSLNDF